MQEQWGIKAEALGMGLEEGRGLRLGLDPGCAGGAQGAAPACAAPL